MSRYIWHIALGSGEASKEPLSYTADQLGAWRGHIADALEAPRGAQIPGKPGYGMSARAIGSVLLCTVGRADDETPLVTFSIVPRALQARKAWKALHEGYPQFKASLNKVPQAPYCAVRAEVGLIYDQGAGTWLDGYQLAVAWAWLTRGWADA